MEQEHQQKNLLGKLEIFILSNLKENKEKTFTASEDLYLWLCHKKNQNQTLTKIANDIQIKIPQRTVQQIKYKIQTLNLLNYENVQSILKFFQSTQQDPNLYKIGFDKNKNFKQLTDFSGKKKVDLSAYQNEYDNQQNQDYTNFQQNKSQCKNKNVFKSSFNDMNEIYASQRNQNLNSQNENQCNDSIQTISKVELSLTKKKALNHALNYMINNVGDLDDSLLLKINELNNYAISDSEKVYQKCLQYNRMMHEIKNKQRIQFEVDIIKQKCEYINNEQSKFKVENNELKKNQYNHEEINFKKYIRID